MKNHAPSQEPVPDPPAPAVELDLSRHCIQTATRRCYETLVAAYFKAGAGRSDLEPRIGLLHQALETLDFPALRSRWPELAGGRAVKASLLQSEGQIVIRTEDRTIRAPLRSEAEDPTRAAVR